MKSCVLSILLIVFVSQCHASEVDITTKNVPNGTASSYYSAVITADGGCTPYKWAVVSGKLPPGVRGTASTKTTSLNLSGTPTVAASYAFTVSVTGCGGSVSKASYKIVINSEVGITSKNVPNGTANSYYSAAITANGGCTPYKWAVVSGKLPPGVRGTASTKTTSLDLSGTPTVAASYAFTVSVTGCGGHVSTASYKIVVNASASEVDITTKTVPNGTANSYYSAVITADGGCTPYKWAVVSGKLPPGVRGTASTKTTSLNLSGTPTVAASYAFTVSVAGCGGSVSNVSYNLVIKAGTSHVVDLRWEASTSTDIAGYNLYRGPDGVRWQRINASLVASTYYNDSTVTDGGTYYYSATAVSVSGEESKKTPPIKVSIPE